MKERLISGIRTLTKRIGQAKENGVTELVERLRIARIALATRLARDYDLWLLVNAEGKTEFVDPQTFKSRVETWRERKRPSAGKSAALADPVPKGAESTPSVAPQDPVREFFGEPISTYTRAQALEDGVLVDVTSQAQGSFKTPVALTAELWARITDILPGTDRETIVNVRLTELFRAAEAAAETAPKGTRRVSFPMLMASREGVSSVTILADCGPGDRGEPVITIGFPRDF